MLSLASGKVIKNQLMHWNDLCEKFAQMYFAWVSYETCTGVLNLNKIYKKRKKKCVTTVHYTNFAIANVFYNGVNVRDDSANLKVGNFGRYGISKWFFEYIFFDNTASVQNDSWATLRITKFRCLFVTTRTRYVFLFIKTPPQSAWANIKFKGIPCSLRLSNSRTKGNVLAFLPSREACHIQKRLKNTTNRCDITN